MRPPIPSPQEVARAERLVHEVYVSEYALLAVADRQALARKMLQQAAASDDPAARYVLLREARDIASGAGDARTCEKAVARLAEAYGLDRLAMLRTELEHASRCAASPELLREAAHVCLESVDLAVLADDYRNADAFVRIAAGAAKRARDNVLAQTAQTAAGAVREMEDEFARVGVARELLTQGHDPVAAAKVGRFLCFIKNDWTAGLPLMSKGPDSLVAKLARQELEDPQEAPSRLAMAEAWWDLGEKQTGLAQVHLRQHAARWYRLALPELKGLDRGSAEKRIESVELAGLRAANLEPGLLAELFKGTEFAQLVGTRIDAQVNFDWGLEAPDESLPKDNFSIRWTGMLRATEGGRYQITVIANLGARIWIDDKLVLDAPALLRYRSGQKFVVNLGSGMHPLRIDYWDTTGLARMKLLWQPPRSREEPVPAGAFYHERALR